MNKHTISRESNEKVAGDMKIIVEELKSRIPKIDSIFLTGGFARGEGPMKKIGTKFYPYNDYDIQVISKTPISKIEVDSIADDISRKLGYGGIKQVFYPFRKENQKLTNNFYIDLKVDSVKSLKKSLPRIRVIDLKKHSLLLFGKDTREEIPEYEIRNIPLSEGAKILLDRVSQMIEYFSIEGKHDPEYLTYTIQQAYAACLTSLLLLNGKYEIGYKKSMEIFYSCYKEDFPELYEKLPNLHNKIKQFILWKIDPKKIPNKNVEKEWFIAKESILEVSKFFFSNMLGKKIESNAELSKAIQNMGGKFYTPYLDEMVKRRIGTKIRVLTRIGLILLPIVLGWKYFQRLREMGINNKKSFFRVSPDLTILSSGIFLIDSLEDKQVNENKLEIAKKILSRVYPTSKKNWEEISLDYANAYIAFFMQKI